MGDDRDDSSTSGLTRRGFLGTTAYLAMQTLLARLPTPALPDCSLFERIRRRLDPFTARRANPNYDILRRMKGMPMARSGGTFVWVEFDDDDTPHVMQQHPETPMEWADCEELFDLSNNWKGWNTPAELNGMLRGADRFLIRLSLGGALFLFVTPVILEKVLSAKKLGADWIDEGDFFTSKPEEAAIVTRAEALTVILALMKAPSEPDEQLYFEPVVPEKALIDFRLLRLRTSGWAPRTSQVYTLAELQDLYKTRKPLKTPATNPFIQTSNGWVCLVDMLKGPGESAFPSPGIFEWNCLCPPRTSAKPSCSCLPAPMREAKEMVLVDIFAKRQADKRYIYIGLGHMDNPGPRMPARFRVEPDVEPQDAKSIGDDLAKANKFRKGFPEEVNMPPLLMRLFEFSQSISEPGFFSGQFELTSNGKVFANAWFDGDAAAASQFVVFGLDGDGSQFAFWLHQGRTINNAPIVYLGSEGSGSVIADSLPEFLGLLAVGADYWLAIAEGGAFEESEEPADHLDRFRKWLADECGIKKPKAPAKVVQRARESHPSLEAWIANWKKSRAAGSTARDRR